MKGTFDKRLKSILIKRLILTQEKADEAQNLSAQEQKSYGEVLMEKGYVKEPDLISSIALEMNIPPIDVEKVAPDDKAIQTLTQENAQYYGVLPIARIGNILTLAVSNPFDILKLDNIRLITDCDIRPVVSTEQSIRKAITKAYNPGEEEMNTILDKMIGGEADLEFKKESEEEEDKIDLSEISEETGDSPIIKLVNMIIFNALRDSASDIHIEPFEKRTRVRYRRDGVLIETLTPPKKMHSALVSRIKIMAQLDIAERRVPQDGKFQMRYENRQVDFRVSILPSVHGEKIVMRILDSSSLATSLDTLGFEPEVLNAIRKAINAAYGMLLVTGPTGSGKSTTLYSCVREVLCPEDNIVTVEDPVEYQLEGVIQVPVSVKKGMTFAAALRSILRQDPDTIMIGEIRDQETADIAVKAAITGHLVLSTLHTNDAASTITRLIDMGIDQFMVASSVILVLAQRLARKLCENCKESFAPPRERLLDIGYLESDLENMTIFKPVGCSRCVNGYKGRFALVEALEVDEELKKMIIAGASAIDLKAYAINKRHMMTLRRCALMNCKRGKTSIEEVLRMTMD